MNLIVTTDVHGDEFCPSCKSRLSVTDSRDIEDIGSVVDEKHYCGYCNVLILVSLLYSKEVLVRLGN